jgi:tRNA (cytidine/uridine-2'-O-)-methyltransferase
LSDGPFIHIALMNPEIAPNTGNIGRLALGLNARLHVIHPLGFQIDEKAVRRAGVDYWKDVDLVEHASADSFWGWAEGRRVHLFSTKVSRTYADISWARGDVLLFGPESRGLSADDIARHGAWTIPMTGNIRSLNLANAVAVVAYSALQSLHSELF